MSFFAQVPQSPGSRLAEQLGLSIGQGISRNFPTPEQQVQRRMTQEALTSLDNVPKDATPFDIAKSLISATAGIPGSERYVGQLADLLMRQQASMGIYGGDTSSGTAQQVPASKMSSPSGTTSNQELPIYGTSQPGQPQPQPYQTQGVLPRVVPAEEIESEARKAARLAGDPNRYQTRLAELSSYNKLAENAQNQAREKALQVGVTPDEIPEFMKIGQRYGYLNNLDEWARATQKDWKSYKSNKEKLQNAFIPGFWRGLVTTKQGRSDTLKRLNPLVKANIEAGFEPETREFLASQGLSPTEVEEQIHPLSNSLERKINSIPNISFKPLSPIDQQTGRISNENRWEQLPEKLRKTYENDLKNFIKNNVDKDTSLSVLRHKLWSEKNYPWTIIGPAIRQAQGEGLKLDPWQETEMTEIETQPPRNSLSDIFLDWWRPIEFIKGAK